jgi:Alginate lyase
MPDFSTPVAMATAAVLSLQPAPAPDPVPTDPCALVQVAVSGVVPVLPPVVGAALPLAAGPPSCPLPPPLSAAEPPGPQGAARKPGDLLDLENWFLTLPIGFDGDPDSIDQPELLDYRSEWFDLTPDGSGVVFRAPAGGVTTKNSRYPRSELREMNGEEKAAWSNLEGTHTLESRQAITRVPPVKPEVSATQIHDGDDDVLQIRLEGSVLAAQYADGKEQIVMDGDYQLGTPYDLRIVAADGLITVFYDGERAAVIERSGSSWYWKVGAYTQSNPERGDDPDAVGEVVVYSLSIEHSGGDAPWGSLVRAGHPGDLVGTAGPPVDNSR